MDDDKSKKPEDEEEKKLNSAEDDADQSNNEGADDTGNDDDDSQDDATGDDNADDDQDDDSGDDEEKLSPRENKRIKALTEKLAQARSGQSVKQDDQPANPFEERKEGYSLEDANKIAQDYGSSQYEKGLDAAKALEFKVNLRIDAPNVAAKYDVLNQNSDEYDPSRTAFINELYLRTVGYDAQTGNVRDASLGYEEFVDGLMEAVDRQAAAKSADTAKNVAKQRARQGVRPTGDTKKAYQGDNPKDMSDDQLDAIIAQSLRRRR